MLRNVAAVLVNGFLPFEFGTICEVFGVDRSDDGLPRYDFAVVAGEPPPLRALDFTMQPSHGLERLEQADLIALPAVSDVRLSLDADSGACAPARRFPEDLLEALRRAVDRGARVLSVCSGAFILGDAGLLDDLCLTLSPVLEGGMAGRILAPPGAAARHDAAARQSLVHVLEDDGNLLCRYLRVPGS